MCNNLSAHSHSWRLSFIGALSSHLNLSKPLQNHKPAAFCTSICYFLIRSPGVCLWLEKNNKTKSGCPHRRRFFSCRLSWMILLTNSSSPPSAMISVTPPVFTELGGGRREFLEFTPWRERQDGQGLRQNPIRGLLLSCKQTRWSCSDQRLLSQ